MDNSVDSGELLSVLLPDGGGAITPKLLSEQHPLAGGILARSARVATMCHFGSLLLEPALQSNCLRLEALVHLAAFLGTGTKLAAPGKLAKCFDDLGSGVCGFQEDPAEDALVSLVTTSAGNFRVLEGIWESGVFYLQRTLDIIDATPDDAVFAKFRRSVIALLTLSEAVCNRATLQRYSVGGKTPQQKLSGEIRQFGSASHVLFDASQLSRLGLTRSDLDLFIFDDVLQQHLAESPITESPLQHYPLIDMGDQIALVLPSAISYAIRVGFIEFLESQRLGHCLKQNLPRYYSAFIHDNAGRGVFPRRPTKFTLNNDLPVAQAFFEVDNGRYFHVVFFVDTLESFHETGLTGLNPAVARCIDSLHEHVLAARDNAKKTPGFRIGTTLFVHCGIGRGLILPIPEMEGTDWEIHYLSIADLFTLSRKRGFTALKLWRVFERLRRLTELGVSVHNPNGLLNFIAWIEANEGHMISPSSVPQEFRRSHGTLFMATNFVLDLRQKVANEADIHGVPTVDGKICTVERFADSLFPADVDYLVYTSPRFSQTNGLPLVCEVDGRAWWCHVIPSSDGARDHDHWQMMETWLPRIARELDMRFGAYLPDVVLLQTSFVDSLGMLGDWKVPARSEIDASIAVDIADARSTVTVTAGTEFERGLAQPTNVAERALISSICRGFAELASKRLSDSEVVKLEDAIVRNDDARQLHLIQARRFRDFVHGDLGTDFVPVDEWDLADLRTGLAFRVESRSKGRKTLRSKRQCTRLLNAVVRSIEDELCAELRCYDRKPFIERCLRNHEQAILDRERWSRTARANLAIHSDRNSTHEIISKHFAKLNAVLLSSRVLIEFALCECPVDEGYRPGSLDISRAMARVNAIWRLGGWSNAIHQNVMAPQLAITPLGDIQVETDFESKIVMPLYENLTHAQIANAVEAYEDSFQPIEVADSNQATFDNEFLDAWSHEMGFTVETFREVLDAIEDIGIERKKSVFTIERADLISRVSNISGVGVDATRATLDALTFVPRTNWRAVSGGYDEKDIQPWRFRRRLSAVRRPLLLLDSGENPEYLVAPGFVRDSSAYIVRGYYEGDFPVSQYKSDAMVRWFGKRAGARGAAFAQRVASRIRELGWHTAKTEIPVKEILRSSKDPEFGSVAQFGDVDVLAWNLEQKRVLVIECRELHFRKTFGEIAEQLSDYQGAKRANQKPDDLLKHLQRVRLLRARKAALCGSIGVSNDYQVEGWVVFRSPVPMLYSWKGLEDQVIITIFDDIQMTIEAR